MFFVGGGSLDDLKGNVIKYNKQILKCLSIWSKIILLIFGIGIGRRLDKF